MKKILLISFLMAINVLATGCRDNSKPVREQVSCRVAIDVNLPVNHEALDTSMFNPLNPVTFSSSVTTSFFDIFRQDYLVSAYFLKTDLQPNTWDVYFFFDDQPIDIISGLAGGNNQLHGQLEFDESGELISTLPESLTSEQLILNDDEFVHAIDFIFSKYYTTQTDASFSVTTYGNQCFIET